MANIRRRLEKLEMNMTDASGFVPGSRPWLDYWREVMARMREEWGPDTPRIPLAAYRAIVHGDSQTGRQRH